MCIPFYDRYQLFENNSIVYEGSERQYQFTAEFGKQYSFQVRAVNVIGAGDLSEICGVYIPVPVVETKQVLVCCYCYVR